MKEQANIREQIIYPKNDNHKFFIAIMELIVVVVLLSAAGLTGLLMFITNVLAG